MKDIIEIKLLSKNQLALWLKSPQLLEEKLNIIIDHYPLDKKLKQIFNIKIDKMNNNNGNDHWFSYFVILYNNKIIGTIGSKGKPDNNNSIEIGYGISKKYNNRGFATESIKCFKDEILKFYKLEKIIAKTDKNNIASQKVLLKNNFKLIEKGNYFLWQLKI